MYEESMVAVDAMTVPDTSGSGGGYRHKHWYWNLQHQEQTAPDCFKSKIPI